MSLWSTLGTIGGTLLGGPVGGAIGGALGGAIDESSGGGESGAIRAASQAQTAADDRALALQERMYNESVARQQPFLQAGQQALNKLIPASDYTPFRMTQFQADPGYGFRMSEGMKALERSAAARGGLLSGATMKGIQRYGQDLASQEYTNAFNRYQTERAAKLNPLQSLAGVGQTTANTLGAAGANYGNTVGGIYRDMGTTQGNALLASQGARGSAYGQLGSALGKYLGGGGTFGLGGTNAMNMGGVNPVSGEYYGSLEF